MVTVQAIAEDARVVDPLHMLAKRLVDGRSDGKAIVHEVVGPLALDHICIREIGRGEFGKELGRNCVPKATV